MRPSPLGDLVQLAWPPFPRAAGAGDLLGAAD
jgi:hypothetical protein